MRRRGGSVQEVAACARFIFAMELHTYRQARMVGAHKTQYPDRFLIAPLENRCRQINRSRLHLIHHIIPLAILPDNATEQFGDGHVEWPFQRRAQSAAQSGSFVSMSTMAKVFIDFHMYFFKIPTAPSPIQILARLQNQANQG